MIDRILLASAFGLSLLAMAATGNASCISLGIENNLVANAGCELGTTNNDSQSDPLQVNLDTMFEYGDWFFAEKVLEDPEQVIDIGLTLTGDEQGGMWSIDDVWGSYSDIMLVFKGGGGNVEPSVYVGYLLVNGDTSGTYTTPFFNDNNGNPTDISHVSAYVRHMPEPSSIVLVGLSLVGFAAMRRRTSLS
jgi:hypothetical protein